MYKLNYITLAQIKIENFYLEFCFSKNYYYRHQPHFTFFITAANLTYSGLNMTDFLRKYVYNNYIQKE